MMGAGSEDRGRRKRAFGYIRVSARGRFAQLGAAAQKEAIQRYADKNGLEIVGWQVDEGESGTDLDRPALGALLDAVEAEGESPVDVVLVTRRSRLSRDTEEFLRITARLLVAGVELVSVSEPQDIGSMARKRFVCDMIVLVNEFQRQQHSRAVRRGIKAARLRRLQGE